MNSVFDTLFLPINQGMISLPETPEVIGFFGAQQHPAMQYLDQSIHVQQYFKPYAEHLEQADFLVSPLMEFEPNSFELIIIHVPQNTIEAQGLIAQAARFLKSNGVLICGAGNKSGGARIHKFLAKIGLKNIKDLSKHKSRVCWGEKDNLEDDLIESCIQTANIQISAQTKFTTQPGIFGWNKIDKGSEILASFFKNQLTGHVADFGCGYGYLSIQALKNCDKIRTLHACDADYRAVEACRQNCSPIETTADLNYQWVDLTSPTKLRNLDYVIMNPPFHAQKNTDISIGIKFIEQAHAALSKHGALWMVANAHLPYESTLKSLFFKVEKVFEGQGFKVFVATK